MTEGYRQQRDAGYGKEPLSLQGKRVGLIRPPAGRRAAFFLSKPPLNLAMLGTWLEAHGATVEIRDLDVEPEAGLESWLDRFRPDLLGFTAMTPTILSAARLAARVKARTPNLPIVVGGPHGSALPERTLTEFPGFDYVIGGEGEYPLKALLEALPTGRWHDIPGLSWREGAALRTNPPPPRIENLDTLPLPNRDLLPLERYTAPGFRGFAGRNMVSCDVFTARGCVGACLFCVSQDRKVVYRSAEHVLAELRLCREKYRADHILFLDDTFTSNPERLPEIFRYLRDQRMVWHCTTRVNEVTPALLREMKQSGCHGIVFGIESGSPRVLRQIRKGITVEQATAAFDAAHAAGIAQLEADIILGAHPSETREDIAQSIALIKRLRPHLLIVSLAVPYPGTPLNAMMRAQGLLGDDTRWDEFRLFGAKPSWRTENFSPRELTRIQKRLLFRHYFSLGFFRHVRRELKGWGELKYYLKAAYSFLLPRPK